MVFGESARGSAADPAVRHRRSFYRAVGSSVVAGKAMAKATKWATEEMFVVLAQTLEAGAATENHAGPGASIPAFRISAVCSSTFCWNGTLNIHV